MDNKYDKKRSNFDYNIDVNSDDKILTLSTCNTKTKRTVIHAVVINN